MTFKIELKTAEHCTGGVSHQSWTQFCPEDVPQCVSELYGRVEEDKGGHHAQHQVDKQGVEEDSRLHA